MTEKEVADGYLQAARDFDQAAEDSFERCDTDGFLSQWASGISADLARAKAEIAENKGLSEFPRLYVIADDRQLKAKLVNGRYGAVWLVDEADRSLCEGRTFIPFQGCGNRSRVQSYLGLEERLVLKPAHAIITGTGTGLSGNAWVDVVEVNEVYSIYLPAESDPDA